MRASGVERGQALRDRKGPGAQRPRQDWPTEARSRGACREGAMPVVRAAAGPVTRGRGGARGAGSELQETGIRG